MEFTWNQSDSIHVEYLVSFDMLTKTRITKAEEKKKHSQN